jgi:hypothetical protein
LIQSYNASPMTFSRAVNEPKEPDPIDRFLRGFRRTLFAALAAAVPFKDDVLLLSSEDFGRFLDEFLVKIGPVGLVGQRESWTHNAITCFVRSRYECLHSAAIELVARNDVGLEVEEGFNQTVARFKTEAAQMVNEFEPIVAARQECKQVIRDEMPKALSRILASLADADGQLSLLAFGLSQAFHVKLIPFTFDLLTRFGGINDAACQNVQVDAEATARKCLDAFVWNRRRMLSALIAQGMTSTDWLDSRSPREASISISFILQELAYIWRHAEWIMNRVGAGDDSSSHGSRSSRTKFSGYSGSAFNSSQGPLFSGLRDDNVHQIDRYFTTIN